MNRITAWRKIANLDPRSLLFFRVFFGLFLFLDFIHSLTLATTFYSDQGAFPGRLLENNQIPHILFRIFLFSDHWLWSSALLSLCAILAALFSIGIYPRAIAFFLWILVCGYHIRNPWVLHGGDTISRVFLFWSIFLSLPSGFNCKQKPEDSSLANFAFILQLSLVYFFTFALKSHPIWRKEGTAIYYALHLCLFARAPAKILLAFPGFCRVLSIFTVYWEGFAPALLFSPFKAPLLRCIVVFGFVLFHLSLGFFLNVGMFGFICATLWITLLPAEFYELWKGMRLQRAVTSVLEHLDKFSQLIGCPLRWVNVRMQGILSFHWLPTLKGFEKPLLLFYILIAVVGNLDQYPKSQGFPPWVNKFIWYSGLNQGWGMFAPFPRTTSGFLVIVGNLRNGWNVNLMNPKVPLNFEKPKEYSTLTSTPWKKFFERLESTDTEKMREAYAKYLCREYQDPDQPAFDLTALQIYYITDNTPPPGQAQKPASYFTWTDYQCFGPRRAI